MDVKFTAQILWEYFLYHDQDTHNQWLCHFFPIKDRLQQPWNLSVAIPWDIKEQIDGVNKKDIPYLYPGTIMTSYESLTLSYRKSVKSLTYAGCLSVKNGKGLE
jgi:hypothetical protein